MKPGRSALSLTVLLGAAAGAAPPPAPLPGPESRPRVVLISEPERPIARGATAPSSAPESYERRAWYSPRPERVSLSVKDADLVEVVRSFAKIAGLNLVVDPSVRGTVTAELADVPWDRALAVILKTNGLGMEIDGRVITVATPGRLYRSE